MPREVFVTGQVLTADELNTVSDQTVMTFAGTAARGSAIPSPTEGMLSYLADSDRVEVYTTAWNPISTGKILQVVTTAKTDTFSASVASGATTAFTGLTASITPASTANRILVMLQLAGHVNTDASDQQLQFILKRGSTAIGIGDAAGSRKRATLWSSGSSTLDTIGYSGTIVFVDSPATTTSTTYGVDLGHGSGSTKTIWMNRTTTDSDANTQARAISTITLMEVAG